MPHRRNIDDFRFASIDLCYIHGVLSHFPFCMCPDCRSTAVSFVRGSSDEFAVSHPFLVKNSNENSQALFYSKYYVKILLKCSFSRNLSKFTEKDFSKYYKRTIFITLINYIVRAFLLEFHGRSSNSDSLQFESRLAATPIKKVSTVQSVEESANGRNGGKELRCGLDSLWLRRMKPNLHLELRCK